MSEAGGRLLMFFERFHAPVFFMCFELTGCQAEVKMAAAAETDVKR